MKIICDLCVIPMGGDKPMRQYIKRVEQVLEENNIKTQLHAFGTNLEGEWDDVMPVLKKCHEAVLAMGPVRITTDLRISVRTDREESLGDRVRHVVDEMS